MQFEVCFESGFSEVFAVCIVVKQECSLLLAGRTVSELRELENCSTYFSSADKDLETMRYVL